MSSSSIASTHLRRLVAALGALVLVPLALVLAAAPAQADAFELTGSVYDALDAPLPGVSVQLYDAAAATPVGAPVQTDAEGGYALDVEEGSYTLRLTRTSYAPQWYGDNEDPVVVDVDDEGAASIDGDAIDDNVLDDVTMPGTTPHAVSGTVVNGSSTALVGIDVEIFAVGDDESPIDTDTTVAGGAYTLNVPIGHYEVRYTDPSATYLQTWYGGSSTHADLTVQGNGTVLADGAATGCTSLCAVTMTQPAPGTEFPIAGLVVDANGDPVGGAGVAVTPVSPSSDSGNGNTVTGGDDAGTYSVAVLPGTYRVAFSKTGFTAQSYGGGAGSVVTVGATGALSVTPSEDLTDNRLGDVTLADGLGDATISGKVIDGNGGAGLGGITVQVFPEGDFSDEALVTSTTTASSGTIGSWSIGTLKIGTYDVRFSGTSGGKTYDATYYGGATSTSTTPVKVGQSNVVTVNDATKGGGALGSTSMTQSSADTPHPVTGEVDDANGDPVAGVTVTPSGGPSTATATTDDDGGYTLMLKPGTYQIGFSKSGFATATYPGAGQSAVSVTVQLNGNVLAAGTPIPGGELDAVELTQLSGTTSISGRVTSGGSPVSGITVEVFNEGDLTPSGLARPAVTTAGNGTWTVTALKIGTYTVRFTDNVAGAPTYVQTYYGGTSAASAKVVKVGQANTVSVDDVGQPSGALGDTTMTVAAADTTYDVTGSVSDANGDPIVGATATATPQGSGELATDATDEDGAYVLALKAGTYRISLTAGGFTTATYPGPDETPLDVVVQSGGTVLVGGAPVAGGELDGVTLNQGTGTTSISGRVTSGGTPVAGITVEVFNEGDLTAEGLVRPAVTTAGNGTWTVTALKIGTYTVRFTDNVAAAPTYVQTTTGPVKVGQGNQVSLDDSPVASGALGDTVIEVSNADTLHPIKGDVYDANFDALEDVTVTAEPQGGSPAAAAVTTDEDGAYTLLVKAGTYKIRFSRSGFTPKYYLNSSDAQAVVVVSTGGVVTITGDGTVPDNTLDSVELASTTKSPLTGTVVDEDAHAIAGIKVRAMRDGETTTSAEATTAANGTFTIQLPVGTYTIAYVDTVAAAPTYITAYYGGGSGRLVKVATGGAVTDNETGDPITGLGTVALSESGSDTTYDLKGFVYDENYDDPVDGVTVRVLPVGKTADSAALYTGVSGPDEQAEAESGYYRIPVKAGKYWLKYSAPGLATTYLIDYDTYGPVTVTVAGNGDVSARGYDFTGNQIDDVQLLLPAATFKSLPKLSGKAIVGQTVITTLGTLQGVTFSKDAVTVEWFIDGKPADDYSFGYSYEKYKIPLAAATRKISYRVTIDPSYDDPEYLATPSVFTSKPITVPKAAATLKAAYKKGKLALTLAVPGLPKPTGTILVKDGKKKFATIKLTAKSKGKAVLTLTKLKPGKHTLTLSYAGSKTINAAKATVKVKVKKT